MRLAVKKDPGSVVGGGFHYMLHPIAMRDLFEEGVYRQMGYIILQVDDQKGERMLAEASKALCHQLEVAEVTEHPNTQVKVL